MPKDVLRPPPGTGNMGGAALARGAGAAWEIGDVVEYNAATHTATVRTASGRTLRDVPQIKTGPGEFEHYSTGTSVVVTYDLGIPVILGCINFVGGAQTSVPSPSLTGLEGIGDDNPIQPTEGANSYKPAQAPTDMTTGDWARVGRLGNHVAVLEGGVTLLGNTTSQVRSLGLPGVMQLIAQQLQVFTDFGHWKTTNDGGKTSFTLRAGSNQTTQTGLDEENWTIRLDVGASGDLFNFEITEPQGKTLFKLYVDPNGRVQIFGDGGLDIGSSTRPDAEFTMETGPRNAVTHGDDVLDVKGARTAFVGGTETANIASDRDNLVGGSDTLIVEDDQLVSVGGVKTEIITGKGPDEARPGDTALTTKIMNGGWVIDIGNPRDGANVSLLAAFHLRTALGDVFLESGGALKLSARQPVSIEGPLVFVGGPSLTALDGVLTGRAIDPFTGSPHFALGNASKTVWAKK